MKIYQSVPEASSFIADISINCSSPQEEGWSLFFGSGTGDGFQTGFGFYGKSGCVFDSQNNFFGGFIKNEPLQIKAYIFSGTRASYFYQDQLISNALPINNAISFLEFDKVGSSFASVQISHEPIVQTSGLINGIYYNNVGVLYNGSSIIF